MKNLVAVAAASLLLGGCSPQSFFYYPNRNFYNDPAAMGIQSETVQYPSLNGKMLWALWMPTDQPPKGTVVHFHGNFGNVSNHFPLSVFLIKKGFDVLIFDYEGYGASEGHPSPRQTVDDGIATVRYAQAHLRNPKTGVVVFGQSLGGAVAVVVAAKEPLVRAAVIEAAFASYRSMAQEALRRSAWTWLLAPIAPLFLSRSYDPVNFAAGISPRPVTFIHGDLDHIVPTHMSRELFASARAPKRLWIVEGADHLNCGRVVGKKYADEIAGFFAQSLKDNAEN